VGISDFSLTLVRIGLATSLRIFWDIILQTISEYIILQTISEYISTHFMDMDSSTFLQQELRLVYHRHVEAIQVFEKGNIRESRSMFAEVCSTINQLFGRAYGTPDIFFFPGSPVIRECIGSPLYSDKSIFQNRESEDPKMDENECSSRPDIPLYSRILKLPTKCSPNQFLFIALYNLAISTHLAALHSLVVRGENDTKLIGEAAQLWELTYGFQWRESLNLRPIHALSILINLGHIQSILGNEDSSKKCFEKVLSACQILEGRNQEVPSREFFLYQALRMLGLTFRQTAAAA